MEDFLSRLAGGEDEGDQGDARRKRGHQHGHETFLRAAGDERDAEGLALTAGLTDNSIDSTLGYGSVVGEKYPG
jgi:hypothetical protein